MDENNLKEKEMIVVPELKIKVFISSNCGIEKYDKVRIELKRIIEGTQLAEVYTFEGKGASSLTAGSHYTFALEDSDICIFLIDNADGIGAGVQKEIDTVKKRKIKTLYYFCDEKSKEKTATERSLIGAEYAKSKTIHKFDDLIVNGAQDLINDITAIYHHYCKGRFVEKNSDGNDEFHTINIVGMEKMKISTIPKSVLSNIDKCKLYILKVVTGYSERDLRDGEEKTSEFDDWCAQFLDILFKGKSIKEFNAAMYMETLKSQQEEAYYNIVQFRWSAIQAYFSNDINKCIGYLQVALKEAKRTGQPIWVIKDILIDLRNQQRELNFLSGEIFQTDAQTELTDSEEELYYPLLDRMHDSLQEKYIEGLYKKKIESPYTVTLGNNLYQYGELLTSAYIVSMYNGSLTHILLLYEKIRDFLFYLTCKYDNWNFRRDLLKMAIYEGKDKEVKGILNSYPEVLNNMGQDDAVEIMEFCRNNPIRHRRFSSELLAFGTVGYYLNDEYYTKYEKIIVDGVKTWICGTNPFILVAQNIFYCLSRVAYRMNQDVLSEICCLIIDNHHGNWYTNLFQLIAERFNLCQMSEEAAQNLIKHIVSIIEDDKEREMVKYSPSFLWVLRKQNAILTNELDRKVAEYLPEYYNGNYKLETTENAQQDLSDFINEYIGQIKTDNMNQGKNGLYYGHGTRYASTIRSILLYKNFACNDEVMDDLVSTLADTLVVSKEGIATKLDTVSLLTYIVLKHSDVYERNKGIYEHVAEKKEEIVAANFSLFSSNVDSISLKIGICLLLTAMGADSAVELLEYMPCIQNDIATTISVTKQIIEYLESADDISFPNRIETIIIQNVLLWLKSDYVDIRWNATRILLMLLRNPENESIVNRQLIYLIDNDCVYIKNLIMRQMKDVKGITESTKAYILSECEKDANYLVRMVCEEEKINTSI